MMRDINSRLEEDGTAYDWEDNQIMCPMCGSKKFKKHQSLLQFKCIKCEYLCSNY